jgi:DNA-binding CsgD family transcriptional regulator
MSDTKGIEVLPAESVTMSTTKVYGQTVWFQELSESELSELIPSFTPGELRMLTLAAQGLKPGAIAKKLGLGVGYVRSSLRKPAFKNAFHTVSSRTAFSIGNLRSLAQASAAQVIDRFSDIALNTPIDDDTKPATLAQVIGAGKELLSLGGVYREQLQAGEVNIGNLLISLTREDTSPKKQWER